MEIQNISIDDAEPLFRGRMGLVFGPGITVEGDFVWGIVTIGH